MAQSVPLVEGIAGAPGVAFQRRAEGAGGALEDRLADVVRVAAVMQQDVQVHPPLGGDRLPEVGDQLAVERPDLRSVGIVTSQTQ